MADPLRAKTWGRQVMVAGFCLVAAAASGCGTPTASPNTTTNVHEAAKSPVAALPAGVVPRKVIMTRYQSTVPGVMTEAKLVSLAHLEAASKGELTQCQFRGCPTGTLVWLVLQKGRPGAFSESGPPGIRPSGDAAAWSLFPVDASTGKGRGDSAMGPQSQLYASPWGQLRDLAASR